MKNGLFTRGVFAALAGAVLLSYFAVEAFIHDDGLSGRSGAVAVSQLAERDYASLAPAVPTTRDIQPDRSLSPVVLPVATTAPVPAEPVVLASRDAATEQTGVVTARAVNLRAEPTMRSGIVGRYKAADEVVIVRIDGQWAEVRTSDGKTGWMNRRFITLRPLPSLGATQPAAETRFASAD